MALAPLKTWVKETLTFQDLNAEFLNILNNATALISPATGTWDLDGNSLLLDSDGDTALINSTGNTIQFQIGGTVSYIMTTTGLDLTGKILDLDDDNDTSISAEVDDTIQIEIGGTNIYTLTASAFDFNGKELILDADGDSSITVDTDDVAHLRLQAFDSFIFDGNVASPVNGITFTSSDTGNPVTIAPHGEANTGLTISPAGTGTVNLDLNAGELILDADGDSSITVDTDDVMHLRLQAFDSFIFDGNVSTPVNGLTFTSSDTGNDVSISAHGESNTSIDLVPAGTGTVKHDGNNIHHVGEDFESSEQALTADTLVTVAHSLSAIPNQVWGVLRCKSAEFDYGVDEEVDISTIHTENTLESMGISADATNIYVIQGTAAPRILNKNNPGTLTAITRASWRIVVKARLT